MRESPSGGHSPFGRRTADRSGFQILNLDITMHIQIYTSGCCMGLSPRWGVVAILTRYNSYELQVFYYSPTPYKYSPKTEPPPDDPRVVTTGKGQCEQGGAQVFTRLVYFSRVRDLRVSTHCSLFLRTRYVFFPKGPVFQGRPFERRLPPAARERTWFF